MGYIIKGTGYMMVEDSYKEGQGKVVRNDGFDIYFEDESLPGVLAQMANFLNVDIENAIADEAYPGDVIFYRQETEDGDPPSKDEIASWKMDKRKLYDAYYRVKPLKTEDVQVAALEAAINVPR